MKKSKRVRVAEIQEVGTSKTVVWSFAIVLALVAAIVYQYQTSLLEYFELRGIQGFSQDGRKPLDLYSLVSAKQPPPLLSDLFHIDHSNGWSLKLNKSMSLTSLARHAEKPTRISVPRITEWPIFDWNLLDNATLYNITLPMTRWQEESVFVLGQERDKGGMIGWRKDSLLAYTNITMTQFFDAIFDNDTYLYWTGELEHFESVVGGSSGIGTNNTESSGLFHDWRDFRIKEEGIASKSSEDEEEDGDLWRPMLWLSHPGVVAQTHYDTQHNVFLQVFGRKRFLLFPPETELYSYPNIHRSYRQSQIHLEARPSLNKKGKSVGKPAVSVTQQRDELLTRFPRFQNTSALEFILNPGDVLYIPPYWAHRVESLTSSLSLSVLSPSYVEASLAEVYWENVPFGAFQESRLLRAKAVILYLRLLMEQLTSQEIVPPSSSDDQSAISVFAANLYHTRFETLTTIVHPELKEGCAVVRTGLVQDVALPPGSKEKDEHDAMLLEHLPRFQNATVNIANMLKRIQCRPPIKVTFLKDYVEQIVRWAVGPTHVAKFIQNCLK